MNFAYLSLSIDASQSLDFDGLQLDDEFTKDLSIQFGDLISGGNSNFRIAVLSGDSSGDGFALSNNSASGAKRQFEFIIGGTPSMNDAFSDDINGDGFILSNDTVLVANQQFLFFPPLSPMLLNAGSRLNTGFGELDLDSDDSELSSQFRGSSLLEQLHDNAISELVYRIVARKTGRAILSCPPIFRPVSWSHRSGAGHHSVEFRS